MPQSSVLAYHVRLLFSRMLACLPLPLAMPGVVKETAVKPCGFVLPRSKLVQACRFDIGLMCVELLHGHRVITLMFSVPGK